MRPYHRYRSLVRLARALVWTAGVACLALSAAPGRAADPAVLTILQQPNTTEVDAHCSNLGNLVTITRTVLNVGSNDQPANQAWLYVDEITNLYSQGKDLDAHLHSSPVYIPAMPARGPAIQLTLHVGTVKSYLKKLPGPHLLDVHLVSAGTDNGSAALPIKVTFPAGYCQPLARMPLSRMHLRAKATMKLPPPEIRLVSETHHVDKSCADRSRLITFNMRVRNDGGPLGVHKAEIWVEDDRLVLPYDGVLDEKWIPPLMPGGTANATVYVGVLKRNIGQLPGAHTLDIAYYNGTVLPNGVRGIARKPVTVVLPKGICQPRLRVPSPGEMRLKAGKSAFPPSPCIGSNCRRAHRLR